MFVTMSVCAVPMAPFLKSTMMVAVSSTARFVRCRMLAETRTGSPAR